MEKPNGETREIQLEKRFPTEIASKSKKANCRQKVLMRLHLNEIKGTISKIVKEWYLALLSKKSQNWL